MGLKPAMDVGFGGTAESVSCDVVDSDRGVAVEESMGTDVRALVSVEEEGEGRVWAEMLT